MSFKAPGVRVPSSFAKNNQRSQFQNERDRMVEVVAYHIAPDPSQSYMRAREIDPNGPNNGRMIHVSIRDRGAPPSTASATNANGQPRKWSGNIIDDKMRQHVPVGSWVALERTSVERKFKEGDAEGYVVKANYINRLEPSPDKSMRAVFTISAKDNRVFQVQVWDRQTINYTDDASVNALAAKMDAIASNWKAGEETRESNKKASEEGRAVVPFTREPGIGVQFRAISPTGEKDRAGKTIYQMIDCTPPIDWIGETEDGAGNTIAAHPVTGEQMRTFLDQYDQYLMDRFPSKEQATLPDGTPNPKYKEEFADLTVEIMVFRTYWTSKMSQSLVIRGERSPLHRMVSRPTLCSLDEPGEDNPPLSEKNWAVDGIVALSADKPVMVNGAAAIDRRQFVQGLYTNAFMNNVHALVRSSDGLTVKPHPHLNYQAPAAAENTNTVGPTGGTSGGQASSAPADGGLRPANASAAVDPFADGYGAPDPLDGSAGAGDDVYSSALSSGTSVPPVAAPEPQPMTPSAPAPAPAPSTGRRRSV